MSKQIVLNDRDLLLQEYKLLLAKAKEDVNYYSFAIDYLEGKPQPLEKNKSQTIREHYYNVMEYLHGR